MFCFVFFSYTCQHLWGNLQAPDLPFLAFSWGIFWALSLWSKMYIISPPKLMKRSGKVLSDMFSTVKFVHRHPEITILDLKSGRGCNESACAGVLWPRWARSKVEVVCNMDSFLSIWKGTNWSFDVLFILPFFIILIRGISYYRNERIKDLPPCYGGWIPWIGCAFEFGKSPLYFIQSMQHKVMCEVSHYRSFKVESQGPRLICCTSVDLDCLSGSLQLGIDCV